MPAKKKSVTTPLHLLQQLSHSLIEHLDKACSQAIKDAEGALAKLQKQRGKAQCCLCILLSRIIGNNLIPQYGNGCLLSKLCSFWTSN